MSDFKDKVLSKIEHEKPVSSGYFVALDWIRALAITTILFLGGVLLAFLLWDWVLIPQIIDFTVDNLLYIFLRLLPLIIITSLIVIFLGYYLYRQTDWPLVRKRSLLTVMVLSGLLIITIVGLGFIKNNVILQNSLRDLDNRLENLSLRPPRPRGLIMRPMPDNIIVGRITDLKKNGANSSITVDIKLKTISLNLNEDQLNDLDVGNLIRVELDSDNPTTVKKITKIDKTEVIFQNDVMVLPFQCTDQTTQQPDNCVFIDPNLDFEIK